MNQQTMLESRPCKCDLEVCLLQMGTPSPCSWDLSLLGQNGHAGHEPSRTRSLPSVAVPRSGDRMLSKWELRGENIVEPQSRAQLCRYYGVEQNGCQTA